MTFAMTRQEREQFLAELHVGIISIARAAPTSSGTSVRWRAGTWARGPATPTSPPRESGTPTTCPFMIAHYRRTT